MLLSTSGEHVAYGKTNFSVPIH